MIPGMGEGYTGERGQPRESRQPSWVARVVRIRTTHDAGGSAYGVATGTGATPQLALAELRREAEGLAQQAGGLARQSVELLFQNSLSAPTKKGSKLARYYGDVAMYNSHISALQNNHATYVARAHFGRPTGFRGL